MKIRQTIVHAVTGLVVLAAAVSVGGCLGMRSRPPAALPTQAVAAILPTATDEQPTASAMPAQSPTPGPSATPSPIFTPGPTPTITPTPSLTPTSRPQIATTLDSDIAVGDLLPEVPTPETPIPTAVPTFEVPADTTNIPAAGQRFPPRRRITHRHHHDRRHQSRQRHRFHNLAAPRFIRVYPRQHHEPDQHRYGPRRRKRLRRRRRQTCSNRPSLYNFGIPIHYYARIDFAGFQEVVDAIGGVDIAVSCRLQDWRLKSPELDINEEDNWEQFALEPGIHQMDGDLALWYARSRLSTSDFDRGRRQQQLLRAILNQGVDFNLLPQVPTLWDTFKNKVDTDMDIGLILQLVTLAPSIRENGVQQPVRERQSQFLDRSFQRRTGAAAHLGWRRYDGRNVTTIIPSAGSQPG